MADGVPEVLFVCVHNAGRSQMAAGLLERMSGGRVRAISAGSEPGDSLNPAAVQAMEEVGIDISAERPRKLEDAMVRQSDVVITMGCGDACPIYPGKRYEDWDVEDPSGADLQTVRRIREEIANRITELIAGLEPERSAGNAAKGTAAGPGPGGRHPRTPGRAR